MRKSMIITQCGECKDRSLSLTSWMFEEGRGRLPGGGDVKDPISEAEHHVGTEECGEEVGGWSRGEAGTALRAPAYDSPLKVFQEAEDQVRFAF